MAPPAGRQNWRDYTTPPPRGGWTGPPGRVPSRKSRKGGTIDQILAHLPRGEYRRYGEAEHPGPNGLDDTDDWDPMDTEPKDSQSQGGSGEDPTRAKPEGAWPEGRRESSRYLVSERQPVAGRVL